MLKMDARIRWCLVFVFLFDFLAGILQEKLLLAMYTQHSSLDTDEELVFFPTYAVWEEESQCWQANVHGWVYELERRSTRHALALHWMEKWMKVKAENKEVMSERLAPFFADNEGREEIVIRLGKKDYPLPLSDASGHFSGKISLTKEDVASCLFPAKNAWIEYQAVLKEKDKRICRGIIYLISPQGNSIISDIDDTIKITNVNNRQELLYNTFSAAPQAAPGMQERYQRWQQEGAVFHYVSASPWQLFSFLHNFIEQFGFPKGTYHLKKIRINPLSSDFYKIFDQEQSRKQKTRHIQNILKDFPCRSFCLLGDTAEKDPEIYAEICSSYPSQIQFIYLRNVSQQDPDDPKWKALFGEFYQRVEFLKVEPEAEK